MSFLANISVGELGGVLDLVEDSSRIERHLELFDWLQTQVQQFIPHNVLITAWGDFSLGLICHDIVSPLSGMRTESVDEKSLLPFLTSMFKAWEDKGHQPHALASDASLRGAFVADPLLSGAIAKASCGLVHGIKDKRGRHDCLYVFLGPAELGDSRSYHALRFLLPHIDAAFRQICPLPTQELLDTREPVPSPLKSVSRSSVPAENGFTANGLSSREAEIMQWVRLGKTNQEIGMILDISAFTVKNHLQRIFKKLNVTNRAQAASSLS